MPCSPPEFPTLREALVFLTLPDCQRTVLPPDSIPMAVLHNYLPIHAPYYGYEHAPLAMTVLPQIRQGERYICRAVLQNFEVVLRLIREAYWSPIHVRWIDQRLAPVSSLIYPKSADCIQGHCRTRPVERVSVTMMKMV